MIDGYDYTTHLKGAYYNNLVGEENLTKQKNIFYDNNIDITYQYEIPSNNEVVGVEILYNQQDVSKNFNVSINLSLSL